jgi:microcystin-dependent protein
MSYLLDKTNNNSPKITVADGTFDNTSTSLTLVGRAFLGWGEPFNENFLALLENFNDVKPPRSPVTGQLWYDSTAGKMKFYNGSIFTALAVFPPASEGYLYDNGSGITQWVSASQLSSNLNKSLFPTVDANSPTYNKNGYLVKNPDGSYSWVTGDNLLNGALPPNTTTNPGGGTGTGVLTKNPDGSYSWININTLAKKTDLDNAAKYLVPAGGIIMWSGTVLNIPTGWVLCDGTKGTPDLRDRFIIGAGTTVGNTYAVGNTGGSADAIAVSHTHTMTSSAHRHNFPGDDQLIYAADSYTGNKVWDGTNVGSFSYDARSVLGGGGGIYTTSEATAGGTIASAGVSGTNANLPPYYALAFIMKT